MLNRDEILSDLNEALSYAERIQYAANALVDELERAIETAEDEDLKPDYENLADPLGSARQEWRECEGGVLDTDQMLESILTQLREN